MVSKELDYDIVVVGGGPAGSSAAFAAAKNGAKVALLEKEECISQSVRTSGVTWIKDVKKFGIPSDCYNEIKNYSFCSPNNQVSVRDSKPRAVVLDVRKTYQWLAEQAAKEGADIFVKTNVIDVIRNNQGKISGVKTSSKENCVFNSKIVIDASGFQSVVAKSLCVVTQWERFAGEVSANAIKSGDTSEKSLKKYEENWKKAIKAKINSASKIQDRWIGLSDEEWDKEIEIIGKLTPDEFIDFIKADFGLTNMVKLAAHPPKLAVRHLFNIVKGSKSKDGI